MTKVKTDVCTVAVSLLSLIAMIEVSLAEGVVFKDDVYYLAADKPANIPISLLNLAKQDVIVSGVQFSCPCLKTSFDKFSLKPNAEKIIVATAAPHPAGASSVEAIILYDGGISHSEEIKIKVVALPPNEVYIDGRLITARGIDWGDRASVVNYDIDIYSTKPNLHLSQDSNQSLIVSMGKLVRLGQDNQVIHYTIPLLINSVQLSALLNKRGYVAIVCKDGTIGLQ